MNEPLVKLNLSNRRADVVLARPKARNALNLQMCQELTAAFETIAGRPEISVVTVTAEGPVFCAGADMKERTDKDEAWVMARRRASFRAYDTIAACAVPVICAVQGPLVGSGGEIAMSCDFILASSAATFRFPEPQWGTVGATQRLQRVIGLARAKELLYTGRVMASDEALRLGLITRLAPPEALTDLMEETVAAILAAPPLAMRLTKQCLDLGSRTDLASGIRVELAAIEQNLRQSDWRGGVARFSDSVGTGKGES